jgi:hypothetical protein
MNFTCIMSVASRWVAVFLTHFLFMVCTCIIAAYVILCISTSTFFGITEWLWLYFVVHASPKADVPLEVVVHLFLFLVPVSGWLSCS